MSRCFPYPPPCLGEAEIESIKKEKERLEEAAKQERKREKKEKKEKRKKEKKEKRSGEKQELSKELKKSLKRKYEELGLVEPDEKHDNSQHCHKSKKPRDEQLTNSCVTEEHGQPNTVGPGNLDSPERSQDSSRRIHSGSMPSPSPSLSNSGSTIRIKLQSKSRECVPETQTFKQKGSVSAPQLAKSREVARAPQATKNKEPVSGPQGSKVEEQFSFLVTPKQRTASTVQKPRAVPGAELIPKSFRTRATILPTQKSKEPVTESVSRKSGEVLPHAPKAVPKENGIVGLQKKPQGACRSDSGMVPSISVDRSSVSTESSMKAKLQPCAQTQVPKERRAFQKPLPVVRPKLRDVTVSPAINQDLIQHSVQPVKPKGRDVQAECVPASKPAPVVQQQVQVLNAKQRIDGLNAHILQQGRRPVSAGMRPVAADEPCFSGRISEAEEKRKSKHHHKHSSKRSKREEADKLFEELISNWKPPVVEHFQEDEDDLDWLMSGAKKRRVENEQQGEDDWLSKSSSKCKAGEGLLGHANGTAASMYQTRAVYMPELDMYQLPYVMPF